MGGCTPCPRARRHSHGQANAPRPVSPGQMDVDNGRGTREFLLVKECCIGVRVLVSLGKEDGGVESQRFGVVGLMVAKATFRLNL